LLDLGQALLQHGLVGDVGQQLAEPVVGQAEDGFVVPKGVIGVEADRRDAHGR
jgi:hypothetical protein